MKRLLAIMVLTLTSFAFGDSEAQFYQSIASQANGLSPQTQAEALTTMNAGQAAGLSYAGPADVAAALGNYQPAQFAADAAAPAGSTYQDPSLSDPVPVRPLIQQNEAADTSRSPAGDPNLVQDTRDYSTQNLINNGAGGFISAAQRLDSGLDRSRDAATSDQVMQHTRYDNHYGVTAP